MYIGYYSVLGGKGRNIYPKGSKPRVSAGC